MNKSSIFKLSQFSIFLFTVFLLNSCGDNHHYTSPGVTPPLTGVVAGVVFPNGAIAQLGDSSTYNDDSSNVSSRQKRWIFYVNGVAVPSDIPFGLLGGPVSGVIGLNPSSTHGTLNIDDWTALITGLGGPTLVNGDQVCVDSQVKDEDGVVSANSGNQVCFSAPIPVADVTPGAPDATGVITSLGNSGTNYDSQDSCYVPVSAAACDSTDGALREKEWYFYVDGVVAGTLPFAPLDGSLLTLPGLDATASTQNNLVINDWDAFLAATGYSAGPLTTGQKVCISSKVKDEYGVISAEGNMVGSSSEVCFTWPKSPIASDDMATTAMNTPVSVNVDTNDTDLQGNLDPASVVQDPAGTLPAVSEGVCDYSAPPAVSFTPAANFVGVASCPYQICDTTAPTPSCDTAVVEVTVSGLPPVAVDDSASGAINAVLTVTDVTANDTDGDSNLDPASVVQDPAGTLPSAATEGLCDYSAAPAISFTPVTAFTGTASCPYQVCDLSSPTPQCDTAVAEFAYVCNAVKTVYAYTGADQTYIATDNTVTHIEVKAWGAGGGDAVSFCGGVFANVTGGPGGYTEALFPVPASDSVVVVGEGGDGLGSMSGYNPYGFGGSGVSLPDTRTVNDGAGGGLSGFFTGAAAVSATDQARALVVAGGGGGTDSQSCTLTGGKYAHGGNGNDPVNSGGLTTMFGYNSDSSTLPSCTSAAYNPGCGFHNSGGGGGYFGGAAHDRSPGDDAKTESGSGGSGFIAATALGSGMFYTEEFTVRNPPAQSDIDYVALIGIGGHGSADGVNFSDGGDGLVVVTEMCAGFNNPPVAAVDRVTTLVDTNVTTDVSANDADVDGDLDPSSVIITTAAPGTDGLCQLTAIPGEIEFVPALGFVGTTSCEYEICDASGTRCDTAIYEVTVSSPPKATITDVFLDAGTAAVPSSTTGDFDVTVGLKKGDGTTALGSGGFMRLVGHLLAPDTGATLTANYFDAVFQVGDDLCTATPVNDVAGTFVADIQAHVQNCPSIVGDGFNFVFEKRSWANATTNNYRILTHADSMLTDAKQIQIDAYALEADMTSSVVATTVLESIVRAFTSATDAGVSQSGANILGVNLIASVNANLDNWPTAGDCTLNLDGVDDGAETSVTGPTGAAPDNFLRMNYKNHAFPLGSESVNFVFDCIRPTGLTSEQMVSQQDASVGSKFITRASAFVHLEDIDQFTVNFNGRTRNQDWATSYVVNRSELIIGGATTYPLTPDNNGAPTLTPITHDFTAVGVYDVENYFDGLTNGGTKLRQSYMFWQMMLVYAY